ncbi:inactive pancreatic lipase-related protein 1-like [Haliotis cracherodii]|uniref:inactive pancreatic lipase-related protein 1-like n=1 Tax=Haliotis cracherodii TaxID=6455 RepID=UPI0039ECE563
MAAMLLPLLVCVFGGTHGLIFTNSKCYGKYGCFSNASPYNNAKRFLPESPESQGIQFLLYTRTNRAQAQILKEADSNSVHQSHYNHAHPTKMITHGYTDNGRAQWIKQMTQELLTNADCNVIAVNWEKGAAKTNYLQAAANTRVVGAVIADMIKTLHSAGAAYSSFHLIGHSLGSHISGYAGEIVHGVGRITGLDPAGPSFENYDPRTRLDPSDANFVDAIHTDGESLLKLGFGLMKAIGDADFYPNGGLNQPGCPANTGNHIFSFVTGGMSKMKDGVACSHSRVLDFFTSSINNHCSYNAFPCTQHNYKQGHCTSCGSHGCSHMGYHASPSKNGSFFLKTSANGPNYC